MAIKKIFKGLVKMLFWIVWGILLIQIWFLLSTTNQIFWLQDVDSSYNIGLVLGASVYQNWTPSPVLKDRLDTAIKLYDNWVLDRILVSGDNAQVDYNEVHGMSKYLLSAGIPASDIFQDYAGFDTYDSVYRAREIFQVQKMVIITQKFHLPRALAIANALWFETQWVIADSYNYSNLWKMQLREVGARIKAFAEILFGSEAKFSGEVISIEGESNTIEF